jgi:hypothetical protein
MITGRSRRVPLMVLIALTLCLGACSENTRRGAAGGATTGAVASSLGTLVTGLVFNDGNLGERVARSAVYGATAGATAGAIAGAQRDKTTPPAAKPQPQTAPASAPPAQPLTREQVLGKVGPKNVEALKALSDCRHARAVELAGQASQSLNKQYRQASLWIQAIAAIETDDAQALDSLHQQLIQYDPSLKDPQNADRILDQAMALLKQDRVDQGQPPVCPS